GVSCELVTVFAQFDPQLAEVVNLPIEYQGEPRIAHGLTGPFRVDNGQTPMPKKYVMSGAMRVEPAHALIIWTTMSDGTQHALQRVLRQHPLRPRNPTRNSTHVDLSVTTLLRPSHRLHPFQSTQFPINPGKISSDPIK